MTPILQRLPRWPLLVATALFISFQTPATGTDQPAPALKLAGGNYSEDGHTRLEWNLPEGGEVEVQQAQNKAFSDAKTVYRGPDGATFISGLENGTYYYRMRVADSAWSAPVTLTVKHHSLRLALILFAVGAVVFALTAFVVIKGALHTSTE